MSIADALSAGLMPAIVVVIVFYAVIKQVRILDVFTEGVTEGLSTVFKILPTLIALMCASSVFVRSNMAQIMEDAVKPVTDFIGFPSELVPISVMKMFSSSAAVSLLTEIYATYGPDSYIGRSASIMLSATETIFYTMSMYFTSVNIKNTLYTIRCCIIGTIAGVAASVIIARFM